MTKEELMVEFKQYSEDTVKVAKAHEDEIEELKEKIASHDGEMERYNDGIRKIASFLESNNLLGAYSDKEDFIKNASDTPSVLVHVFEKVNSKIASSSVGFSSKVASTSYAETDPISVMALGKLNNLN